MKKTAFKIENACDLSSALTNVTEKQLRFILRLGSGFRNDPEEVVHEIRRTFKKCRALLRLIRDPLGYAAYFRENKSMRDLHRLLSPARDASVLCMIMGDLGTRYPELPQRIWWKKALEQARLQKDLEFRILKEDGLIEQVVSGTREAIGRMEYYHLQEHDFSLIRRGLKRIYRQGKKLAKHSFEKDIQAGRIHNFRKKAKYLQYQLTLLASVFPQMLQPTTKTLQELTDNLGHYHDLYNARCRLPGISPIDKLTTKNIHDLSDKLNRNMKDYEQKAELLARSLYAEKPKRFTSRMQAYWEVHAYGRHDKQDKPFKTF